MSLWVLAWCCLCHAWQYFVKWMFFFSVNVNRNPEHWGLGSFLWNHCVRKCLSDVKIACHTKCNGPSITCHCIHWSSDTCIMHPFEHSMHSYLAILLVSLWYCDSFLGLKFLPFTPHMRYTYVVNIWTICHLLLEHF